MLLLIISFQHISTLVDEKLQVLANNIWDQQTSFEETIKDKLKIDNMSVKQDMKILQDEVDTSLQKIDNRNKDILHNIIGVLKETVVKLEQYDK